MAMSTVFGFIHSQAFEVQGCEVVYVESKGGQDTIMGRLISGKGVVRFQQNKGSVEVEIFGEYAVSGQNIPRLWACREAENRLLLAQDNEAAAELGNRYGVVTSGTSLLVLETLAQYLEHRRTPPESEAKLLEDYLAYQKRDKEIKNEQKNVHLDTVVEQWQELVDWWTTDFTASENNRAVPSVPEANVEMF